MTDYKHFTIPWPSDPVRLHCPDHGWKTGDGPLFVTHPGGILPLGLSEKTRYWAIVSGPYLSLALSPDNATDGLAVFLSSPGSGLIGKAP